MSSFKARIGPNEIKSLGTGCTVWDIRIPGFCARRRETEAVFYAVKYRTAEGRQRWHTIGRHGAPWTPDAARDEARRVLSEVVHGRDPAGERLARRRAATVTELCDDYMDAANHGQLLTRRGSNKKLSTLLTDRSRIESHIKPLLGDRKLPEVTRLDVERFMHDVASGKTKRRARMDKPRAVSNVRGGRGAATRTVGLLGAIFSYGVRLGLCPSNPVLGVIRFADGKRDRRLSRAEYKDLGDGLSASVNVWPFALAAVRFLALTGWRSGEVLGLRWRNLDFELRTARLPDTKTGESMRPLSRAAVRELGAVRPEAVNPDDLVFPSSRGAVVMSGFPSLFERVAKAGGLPRNITPHVLRHSFASMAADLGFSELTIAVLIGHHSGSITSRYTHHADAVLLAAADEVAAHIDNLMTASGDTESPEAISLRGMISA